MELRALLLLPLCFPGLHAQTTTAAESLSEGSTLSIQCSYRGLPDYWQKKAWCLMRYGQWESLVETDPNAERTTNGKVTIVDNPTHMTMSITMTNLQVEDSGMYSCAYRSNSYTYVPLKKISVNVFKELHKWELDSLSVQCPYASKPSRDTKVWCQIENEASCKIMASTLYPSTWRNSKDPEHRVSIKDDTKKKTVTITMEKLQAQDSGMYWCALYTSHRVILIMEVRLSVSKKTQQYTAKESGNVSVQCPYSARDYGAVSKVWCKEGARKPCTILADTDEKPSGYLRTPQQGRVTIQDDTQQGIVTISMEKLQAQDSGTYWCALYEHTHVFRMMEVTLSISEVSAGTTLSGTAGISQTTPSTNTSVPSFNSKVNTFIPLLVVLSILFILAVVILITLCARQCKQLKRRGTRQEENTYEKPEDIVQLDSTERKESSKDDSEDLKYVTLNFKSQHSPEDPLYCNVEPSQTHGKPEDENVEYAIIVRKQLPTSDKAQDQKTIQKWEKRSGIQSGNGE